MTAWIEAWRKAEGEKAARRIAHRILAEMRAEDATAKAKTGTMRKVKR